MCLTRSLTNGTEIYKRVIPIYVTGTPEEQKIEYLKSTESVQEQTTNNGIVSIKVSIGTNSGMELFKDGLDYIGLRLFIEKLEGLILEHNKKEEVLLHHELH